jgi:hypothetical protein
MLEMKEAEDVFGASDAKWVAPEAGGHLSSGNA